jgi:endonuclease/exonuclease/phosphatase (EEP) superfamily protein YafD
LKAGDPLSRALSAAAFGLAALVLLGAGLAHGGRWSPELDILTHVAPAYLAAGVLALVLAVVARAGKATLAATLCSIAVSGFLVAPEYLRDVGPTAPMNAPGQIKVVQFNAWVANSQSEAAARWILNEQPDIVVLEEGWAIRRRLIAAGYRPACYGCAPAILARSPPLRRFPPAGVWNDASRITNATYSDALGEFTVVGVHGHWPTEIARVREQSERLRRHMAGWPRARIIMAGDFNSTPWSFVRRRADRDMGLIRRTRAVFSWPADRANHNPMSAPLPFLPIDHIYAGEGWATVSVRRGPRLGSDHYPIVAVLAPVRR